MPVLFAITMFVSAALLFLVQPMIAKMILPKFGGSPAVWNTCMVFFQALLLAGYSYAHVATTWFRLRPQAALHGLVIFLPFLALPMAVSADYVPGETGDPALLLVCLLLVSVGLPFFVVSTSAPLLQKWFTATGHHSARDPYYLYAASNLGSMLALVSYPALVEPRFALPRQAFLWMFGYAFLAMLILTCALVVWHYAPSAPPIKVQRLEKECWGPSPDPRPTLGRRLHWIALAFVPSSFMLGVTTYMSVDIAPIPLIWVIPLALYLLTFILVFSNRLGAALHTSMVFALPVLTLLVTFLSLSDSSVHMSFLILLNLLTFFVAAMVCHGELARTRPPTQYLTEFYLWMSLGGVLGGLFNAMIAPAIFTSVAEYYLAMVFACLLIPNLAGEEVGWEGSNWLPNLGAEQVSRLKRWLDFILPAFLGVFMAGLLYGLDSPVARDLFKSIRDHWPSLVTTPSPFRLRTTFEYGIPIVLCYAFVGRPIRCGLGLTAILGVTAWYLNVAPAWYPSLYENVLAQERNFFGVLRVTKEDEFHKLIHGHIIHGIQRYHSDAELVGLRLTALAGQNYADVALDLAVSVYVPEIFLNERRVPLSYYYPNGPIGRLFNEFSGPKAKPHVALIGLGTGSLASYAQSGQKITFYEINPAVVRIAKDPRYFTYLGDCRAEYEIVMGDARLSLERAENGQFGIIVVDAFSSDAIPIHLLTREAIALYRKKLAPDGILALHISNLYLDLKPVVGDLAANFKMACRLMNDEATKAEEDELGKSTSGWVILANREEDFGKTVVSSFFGLELGDEDGGRLVKSVVSRGPAARAGMGRPVVVTSALGLMASPHGKGSFPAASVLIPGIRPGHRISRIQGEKITSMADLIRVGTRLVPGKPVKLTLVYATETLELNVALPETGVWAPLGPSGAPVWTDDFSNILGIYKW